MRYLMTVLAVVMVWCCMGGEAHAQRHDAETGLMYYKNRYHNPEVGRFVSRDPVGYSDGMNLQQYVGSNPIFYLDDLGLFKVNKCEITVIIRHALGGKASKIEAHKCSKYNLYQCKTGPQKKLPAVPAENRISGATNPNSIKEAKNFRNAHEQKGYVGISPYQAGKYGGQDYHLARGEAMINMCGKCGCRVIVTQIWCGPMTEKQKKSVANGFKEAKRLNSNIRDPQPKCGLVENFNCQTNKWSTVNAGK